MLSFQGGASVSWMLLELKLFSVLTKELFTSIFVQSSLAGGKSPLSCTADVLGLPPGVAVSSPRFGVGVGSEPLEVGPG